MNLKYANLLSQTTTFGGAAKRKVEMAFSIALSRRLPLPVKPTTDAPAFDMDISTPVVVDRIAFERIASACKVLDKIGELNEHMGVDAEFIMKLACDLWCARARVAYPLPASYITAAYTGNDLFDRVFNFSHYLSKDVLDTFSESSNEIISLSNGFSALI